jgi:AcrR family transcriptional regulator
MQKMTDFEGHTRTQPRTQRTIADLFEATAQLLENDGAERLTTNHIAARAGYSIGTLYRYFPSKLALIRAMVSQEIIVQESEVTAALKRLSSTVQCEDVVRIFIHAALHPFGGRHRVHAGAMQLLGAATELGGASDAGTGDNPQSSIDLAPEATLANITSEMKFTVTHAVTGVIEAAVRLRPELLASRDFEDQLVSMVLHLLNDGRCAKPDAQ